MERKNIVYASELQIDFNTQEIEHGIAYRLCDPDLKNLDSLVIFTIEHCLRRTLPYGKWTCENGREVVFNREYQPIAQRFEGVVSYADRNEWVKQIVKAEMFYDDSNDPVDLIRSKLRRGGEICLTARDKRECRNSLLICFAVLREFTPKESNSVHSNWSVLD